jgi:hypothetical protein
MKLTDKLREAAAKPASIFLGQLLKEDIARLERLEQLAETIGEPGQFAKAAMMLGWTQGDLRTFELNPELASFIDAVFRLHRASSPEDQPIEAAWQAFHRRRMDLLLGCLSRPRLD